MFQIQLNLKLITIIRFKAKKKIYSMTEEKYHASQNFGLQIFLFKILRSQQATVNLILFVSKKCGFMDPQYTITQNTKILFFPTQNKPELN